MNRLMPAITAEPMAMPLVIALVVLPTASMSAILCLASGSRSHISPMPFALSAIGPKVSIDMVFPVRVSMPMPQRDTP